MTDSIETSEREAYSIPMGYVPLTSHSRRITAGVTAEEKAAVLSGPASPTFPTGGTKADDSKPQMHLLPVEALEEIAKVLTFGAKKYSPNNWRKGFLWSRLISAALRHLFAFMRGEDKDPETGLSHLAHAGCCVMFLLVHQLQKLGKDDRLAA